jgi:hypothetical protein
MPVLPAAFVVRQSDSYVRRKFSWTVMRHFLALAPLPVRVAERSFTAALVAPPGSTQRRRSGRALAPRRAVPLAAIAPAAQEEHLAAVAPPTDDES